MQQGLGVAVGCALMFQRSVQSATESFGQDLVYFWDTLYGQLPVYFYIELAKSLRLPRIIINYLGKAPDIVHAEYFEARPPAHPTYHQG